MAVELKTASDRLELYLALERANRHDSHTVRGQLWYGLTGRIAELQVFVDQWPAFSHVCCSFDSRLFTAKADYDVVVMSTVDDRSSSFLEFFRVVAEQRRWRQRLGAVFQWIPLAFIDAITRVLARTPAHGFTEFLMISRHFNINDTSSVDEFRAKLQQCVAQLPEGFCLGQIREDEASIVAETWSMDVPDKTAYVRWVIRTFPCACVRDQNGAPVAWVLSINFAKPSAAYVVPEHRGKRLTTANTRAVLLELMTHVPAKPFAVVRDGNFPAIRSLMSACDDVTATDILTACMAYYPTKNVDAKLSKL